MNDLSAVLQVDAAAERTHGTGEHGRVRRARLFGFLVQPRIAEISLSGAASCGAGKLKAVKSGGRADAAAAASSPDDLGVLSTASRSCNQGNHDLAENARATLLAIALLRLLVVLVVTIVVLPSPALAVDPTHTIIQYGHRVWRIGEAGLDHAPSAIAQTPDGQIWVGTTDGLYLFDGKQFSRFKPTNGLPPETGVVFNLLVSRRGDLYVASRSGLARITHGKRFAYSEQLGLPSALVEDDEGNIWLGHPSDHNGSTLCLVGRTRLTCHGRRDGQPCSEDHSAAVNQDHELWFAVAAGVCSWRRGAWGKLYPLGSAKSPVQSLAFDAHHSLWAGVGLGGADTGLWKLTAGTWKRFDAYGFDGHGLDIQDLREDSRGSLWIESWNHGLYRVTDTRVDHINRADGLSSDTVTWVTEDREGSIWVATSTGLDQFFDLPITRFTTREGMSDDDATWVTAAPDHGVLINQQNALSSISNAEQVQTVAKFQGNGSFGKVFADSRGRVWQANNARVLLYDHGKRFSLQLGSAVEPHRVYGIAEDDQHDVWFVGRDEKAPSPGWLWRIDRNLQVESIPSPADGGYGAVSGVASDLMGGLWIAAYQRAFYHRHDGRFERLTAVPPPPNTRSVQILPVARGEAWFATSKGATWFRNGRARNLNVASGLPCDEIYGLALDKSGDLWLTTRCDLVEVPQAELFRWQHESGYRVLTRSYGPSSGYFGDEASRLVRSARGDLWFVGSGEAFKVEPGHIAINRLPPPVQVTGVAADRVPIALAPRIILPKLTRNIEIDYAGLSYLQPDLLKFRYRLFGHDRDWNDVGIRRQAFYNDLSPGSYIFQVTACNKDGICNNRGASIGFEIPPAWWQTWWFRTLCVLATVSLIAAATRWRLALYAKNLRLRFDDRLEERTRVARNLHDTLMQTVLASKILAEGGQTFATVPEGRAVLTRLTQWLGSAADEGRAAVNSLRSSSIETNHLAAAFEVAATECRKEREQEIRVEVLGTLRELHPIVRDEIHRIGVEAIRNACAHSGGSRIDIALNYGRSLDLRVRDNGHGMDSHVLKGGKAGHFGLLGMRERAEHIGAKLTVLSSAAGTEIALVVPGGAVYVGHPGPISSILASWSQRLAGRAEVPPDQAI